MNATLLLNRRIKVSLYSDRDKEFLANISAESCSEDDQEASSDKDKENGKQEPDKDSKLKHERSRRNLSNLIEIKPEKSIPNLAKSGSLERKSSLKKRGKNPSSLITIAPTIPFTVDLPVQPDPPANSEQPTVKARNRYFAQSINPELGSYRPKANKIKKKPVVKNGVFNLADFRKFFRGQKMNQKNGQQTTAGATNLFSSISSSLPSTSAGFTTPKPSDQQFGPFQFKKPNDLGLFAKKKNTRQSKKTQQQTTKTQQESNQTTNQQSKNHQHSKSCQQNGNPVRFPQLFCLENSSASASASSLVNPFVSNGKKVFANPFSSVKPFDRNTVNPFKKDYRTQRSESKKENDSIDKNPFKFPSQSTKVFGFASNDMFAVDPIPIHKPESERQEPVLVVLDNSPLPPPPRTYMNTTLFSETDQDDRLNKSIELITLD